MVFGCTYRFWKEGGGGCVIETLEFIINVVVYMNKIVLVDV